VPATDGRLPEQFELDRGRDEIIGRDEVRITSAHGLEVSEDGSGPVTTR
jgi:hypothetical protein